MSDYQLSVICENHSHNPQLPAEHGLAFYIETQQYNILFDTGCGAHFIANAAALQIPLTQLTHVILSHGHYDHSGALPYVLAQSPDCQLIAHPFALIERYSCHADQPVRMIGIPIHARAAVQQLSIERLQLRNRPLLLSEQLGVTGMIPRHCAWEDCGGPFFLDPQGQYADSIDDDQALWIRTAEGLVIILGCCHSGLINTVTHIQQLSGESRVVQIIGGLHLLHASTERIARTITYLQTLKPRSLYVGHCTGDRVVEQLQQRLTETQVEMLHTGMTIN